MKLALTPAAISLTVLPRMTDRSAVLTFLTGETFDGAAAAAMGLVTTAVPEAELDSEVERVCAALVTGHPAGPARDQGACSVGTWSRTSTRTAPTWTKLKRPAVRVRRGP